MKKDDYLKRIFLIIDNWKKDEANYSRIEKLRNQFMDAKTTKELDEIIIENINFIDHVPGLWKLASNARKRIENLRKTKIMLTEKFYLN